LASAPRPSLPDSPADARAGEPFVCSWSGGKDSCLAFHRAVGAGKRPVALLNMLTEGGRRSRSHGLHLSVLQAQADALGLPLVTRTASWDRYEAEFLDALRGFADRSVRTGVFGDIAGEPNRLWVESACRRSGMRPLLPLWGGRPPELLKGFIDLGFQAVIVVVRDGVLDASLLGRPLDHRLVEELTAAGIDPSGEAGEYHTVVTGGPLFARRLPLRAGRRLLRDGCWFLDVSVDDGEATDKKGTP
jgi:uncharacterized protein (TIGR00290 family)